MAGNAVLSRIKPIRVARPDDRTRVAKRYWAFLSYSHADSEVADWLHDAIEQYRVPPGLVGKLTDMGPVPQRLTPIFRDRHELAAARDLSDEIEEALAGSRFLIVLCSPAAAASGWTNREVDYFKRIHPDGCVLAAIIDGQPFAADIAGHEGEECFPEALRIRYDRRGRPTGRRAEPMAADLRESSDGRRLGLLKLIAGMLGLGLDQLVQRESHRRQRRLAFVTGGAVLGMVVSASLALMAINARDEARDQRRAAEGLIGFMLGDLRDRLEPLGRLDVLDSVGARALQFYERQDKRDLSDLALAQRAKALTLMGEIAQKRGDLGGALARYQEAKATTAEAARRAPDDPQTLFNHAQNVFWVGYIDWQRGDSGPAVTAFREYRRLADRMIALAPDKTDYRLERIYADTNLGAVLLDQHQYREAATTFQGSLGATEALLARDPRNLDYQKQLSEMLAYLADAREGTGELDDATGLRQRQLDLLARLWPASKFDIAIKQQELAARRSMSRLLASRGDTDAAIAEAARASAVLAFLTKTEPANTQWSDIGTAAGFERSDLELGAGHLAAAQASAEQACAMSRQLLARDATVAMWRITYPYRCEAIRARLALRGAAPATALPHARQALTYARQEGDAVTRGFAVAASEMLVADALTATGQPDAARGALREALAAWPKGVEEKPHQIAQHAALLTKLGGDAGPYVRRLAEIGYRHPADFPFPKQGAGR